MTCKDVPIRRQRTMIGDTADQPIDSTGMTRMQRDVVVVTVNESENVRVR